MKNRMKKATEHITAVAAALCGMFALSGCSNYDNASMDAGCGDCAGCLEGCANFG